LAQKNEEISSYISELWHTYLIAELTEGEYFLTRVDYNPETRQEEVSYVFDPPSGLGYIDGFEDNDAMNELCYDIQDGSFDDLLEI
jgi:hypothetical protein